MRILAVYLLLVAEAQAWTFTADPVCTIRHQTGTAEMRVTYDPRRAQPYAITVTLEAAAWPDTSPYAIRFEGGMPFTIATDRHRLSADGRSVVAEDSGFGNVLNGLAGGLMAVPVLGDVEQRFPLTGAAAVVERFRACTVPGIS